MLVHIHIPKTGGTSIRHLLAANYGDGFYGTRPVAMQDPIWEKDDREKEKITCLSGHIVYGMGRFFPSIPYYVVFLRDPVDRLLSLYHYLWIKNANRRPPEEQGWTFEQFAVSKNWCCNDNDQTRYVGGSQWRGGNPRSETKVDSKLYKQALRNLKDCYFVGFTETLQEDIGLLGMFLNWDHKVLGNALAAPGRLKKKDLDPDLIDKIMNTQSYDMDLYYEAQQLKEKRFA